jgi:hypothetical protein
MPILIIGTAILPEQTMEITRLVISYNSIMASNYIVLNAWNAIESWFISHEFDSTQLTLIYVQHPKPQLPSPTLAWIPNSKAS